MQQHVEGEAQLLAGIVDADVEVQLLFAQDQPISDAKPLKEKNLVASNTISIRPFKCSNSLIIPYGSRKIVVHQRKYGLHIAIVKPVWRSLQVPPGNPCKSMLRPKGPRTELS